MAPQRSRAANHEKEKPIVIVCNILLKKQESSDLLHGGCPCARMATARWIFCAATHAVS